MFDPQNKDQRETVTGFLNALMASLSNDSEYSRILLDHYRQVLLDQGLSQSEIKLVEHVATVK